MEDDDEFGDLYTDVLKPFSSTSNTSSSSLAPQPHRPSPTPPPLPTPIDLNLQSQDDDISLFHAPRQIPATQTLAPFKFPSAPAPSPAAAAASASVSTLIPDRDSAPQPMVLDSKQDPSDGKDVKFDVEEGGSNGIENMGSDDPVIPGLTDTVRQEQNNNGNDNGTGGGEAEEGDDWDSDSEDDLQIVLNDNNHGPMAMERGGIMGEDDDDDEDGDPLVIVADGDANQGMEEQDWGEDGGQAADGERKEGGEAGKVATAGGGGSVVAPKIGYSNHGYHPFHSQFKVSVLTC